MPSGSIVQAATASLGACIATTLTYPIDIVRARIQTGKTNGKIGFWAILFHIIRTAGVRGLYIGLSSQYIQSLLGNFLFFYFYSTFRRNALASLHRRAVTKESLLDDEESGEKKKVPLPLLSNFLVGIKAAVCQILIMTPINVALTRIKTNSAPASAQNRNLLSILFQIAKQEGFSKLYAGIGPSLILTVNPALEFTIIESLRTAYVANTKKEPENSATFVISALGKIGATLITYPYILAKVRMQNSGETSLLRLIMKIYTSGGLREFYTGMQIQLIKAVCFTCTRNIIQEKLAKIIPV